MSRLSKATLFAAGIILSGMTSAVDLKLGPGEIGIEDLIQDATNLQCINYKVKGLCVWLKCTHFGCYIVTSIVVSHYNPDALFEVTQSQNNLPIGWISNPVKSVINAPATTLLGMAPGPGMQRSGLQQKNKQFFEVGVYGNPVLPLYKGIVGTFFSLANFCNSSVVPLKPYMNSELDLEWRYSMTEALLTASPSNFSRYIGTPSDQWGHVYPRVGSVIQPDPFRAAATAAQRTASIVTTSPDAHINIDLPDTVPNQKTWAPTSAIEGDRETAMWQKNYPRGDSGCKVFPANGVDSSVDTTSSDTFNYLWTLWRRYECCKIRGKFIKRI